MIQSERNYYKDKIHKGEYYSIGVSLSAISLQETHIMVP